MKTLSNKALITLGAAMAYLAPRIAMDAKVDLDPALEGVTAENFGEKQPEIAAKIAAAVEGKLAADADLSDLGNLLDAVKGHKTEDDPAPAEVAPKDDKPAHDSSAALCQFLKTKLSPEDYAQVENLLKSKEEPAAAPAQDDTTPTLTDNAGGSPGTPKAMDEAPEAKAAREKAEAEAAATAAATAKIAQDAAIKEAADKAAAATEARLAGVRTAEKAVRPYVGEIAMDGMNTASDVYRAAFRALGVDVTDVHESAFPALLKAQKPAGTIAQDGGIGHSVGETKAFADRFPQSARLGA